MAVDAQKQEAPTERQPNGQAQITKPISHTLKNQHIRYVPKKRVNFNLLTPDGRIGLVFKAAEKKNFNTWSVVLASAFPAAFFAPFFVPPEFLLYTNGAIFLPSAYAILDKVMRRRANKHIAKEIYLFENGEQLLLKTRDDVVHKLDILHNDHHRFEEGKQRQLIFVMENSGKEFFIHSDGAEVIDYQLLDKYIRAICIDTRRTQNMYHRLLSRQIPANLKPTEFYQHVPIWSFQNVNSSVFIWKYLNRTIYRSGAFEGADTAFLWHLRNKRSKLNAEEQALKDEFGLKIVYPSDLFYKTHKVSQKDFLEQLREARDVNDDKKVRKLIKKLFKDDSVSGRRGVKSLKEGVDLVKKKLSMKERQRRFASKVSGNREGMSFQQLKQSGILRSSGMF